MAQQGVNPVNTRVLGILTIQPRLGSILIVLVWRIIKKKSLKKLFLYIINLQN